MNPLKSTLLIVMLLICCTAYSFAQDADKIGNVDIPDGVTVIPDIAYRNGTDAWKLDLAMPTERGTEPRPAILFIHGGGWANGSKRIPPFLQPTIEYAAKGYVTATVEYRLTGEAPLPACVEDVKCAVRWLRANAEKYNVNPDRIGAYGNSAGAHLVAMLGLCPPSAGLEGDGPYQEYSSMIQAVVCAATPSDYISEANLRRRPQPNAQQNQQTTQRPRSGIGGQTAELRKKLSPITYVNADAPPFLIIHDASDTTVPVRHGDTLYKGLQDAGAKNVNYLRFDQGFGHGVFERNSTVTYKAREEFFNWVLKEGAKPKAQPRRRAQ
jgi:acetyl esterase/lipase